MENRRLLLAAFLSALILIVWSYLFPPPPPSPSVEEGSDVVAVEETLNPASTETAAAATESEAGEDSAPPMADTQVIAAPIEEIGADSEQRIVIDGAGFRAEFTNQGAQLLSYLLTDHFDSEGQPVDLVRERGSDLYPFALVSDSDLARLNSALFASEEVTSEDGHRELRFRHASERGQAEKTFRWDDMGFMDVEISVPGQRDWSVLLGPGLNNHRAKGSYAQTLGRSVGIRQGGESELLEAKKQDEDLAFSARGLQWATLEDNFFMVAMVPREGVSEAWIRPVLERSQVEAAKPRFLPLDTSSSEDDLVRDLMLLARPADDRLHLTTYFGAKQYSYLTQLPFELQETVRWGFLGWLSKPLYVVLEWVHGHVPNYGWAIVLVTCLIKLVFFPLTHKSQQSMGKMQELNPKIQAIRAKYRPKLRDKQGRPNIEAQRQMNEEVMAVYKSAGVNPASGCLPMLLQMPVFFAFYRLLTVAVELRGAPWMLWIQDLSQPDPYWVLPLVMGATSLAMQRMLPQAPDPMQRRLMQMMPIMFTAFAFAFPSGLVLYWLTNNVLTMAQQALIMKMKAGDKAGKEAMAS